MSKNYHIAMFPWFATGHMTPFLHLSNELAQRGHKISFLLPKKAQLQFEPLNLHPDLISFFPITVPHVDGLPPGTETASDVHFLKTGLLAIAMDRTRDQVESILSSLRPDFIFYDFAYWVPEIAKSIGGDTIKTVNYIVVSAMSIAIGLVPALHFPTDRPLNEDDVRSPPAGYPSSTVVLRGTEVRSFLFLGIPFGEGGITFYSRNLTSMEACDAIAIRTCQELEGNMCDYISTQYNKPVFLTGSLLPESTGNLAGKWADWLDRFEPGSVIFLALGSQIILQKNQFQELLLGLEATNRPFLAALKPPSGSDGIEAALPEGFKERVAERGVVTAEWVAQPLILAHEAVGCFVSHAGFGSMWEGLMSEKQLVLVPHLVDQILNTRLLSEEIEVGVEVERDGEWFAKEALTAAVESVMAEGSEVGVRVRTNHDKWRQTLTRPGFMTAYIDNFVQDLHRLFQT